MPIHNIIIAILNSITEPDKSIIHIVNRISLENKANAIFYAY